MTDKLIMLCGFIVGVLGFVSLTIGLIRNNTPDIIVSGLCFIGAIVFSVIGKEL